MFAAGVPCQPFSIGGKHKGHADERNLFPQTIDAIRRLKPMAVIIENVRGLVRQSFAKYFGYIQLMLAYPEIARRNEEHWIEHLSRLERYHTRGKRDGLYYRVVCRVLNAADYGVPQKRERLFMVAIRADLGVEWSFPRPVTRRSPSLGAILHRCVLGQTRFRQGASRNQLASCGDRDPALRNRLVPPTLKPWRTVRDAIADLPEPLAEAHD